MKNINKKDTNWPNSHKIVSIILLLLIILTTILVKGPLLLAMILFLLIFSVKNNVKIGIIITIVYSGILTLINFVYYIENNRNEVGEFETSGELGFLILIIYLIVFVSLINTYKNIK